MGLAEWVGLKTSRPAGRWLTASRVRGGSSSRGGRGGHRRHGAPGSPRDGRGAPARGSPRGGRGARAPPCRSAPARASPPAHGPSERDGGAPCAPCRARGWCGARCGSKVKSVRSNAMYHRLLANQLLEPSVLADMAIAYWLLAIGN